MSGRGQLALGVAIAVLDGLLLVVLLCAPIVWTLRDGLGPDTTVSTGLRAVGRALMTFYGGLAVLVLVVAEQACRWRRRKQTVVPAQPARTIGRGQPGSGRDDG